MGVLGLGPAAQLGKPPRQPFHRIATRVSGNPALAEDAVQETLTLTYERLLEWFWRLHGPTTLNRQGPDRGPQYRSAIFFATSSSSTGTRRCS